MRRTVRNKHSVLRIEQLELRQLLAADPIELNGIGYFPNPSESAIERFDLAGEQWLSPVALSGTDESPDAFHIDADGIFAAYGRTLYRYALDGSSRTHLLNLTESVVAIHADANLLFVNHSAGLYTKLTSINKDTNTVIDTMDDYLDTLGGSSIAPIHNRLFGRSVGTSPSDITFVSYDSSGNLLENGDSPYHGDFAGASRTWVFEDQRYVIDNSGNVYASTNLHHSGRLGTGITDIDFYQGTTPIVLSGNTLTSYSTGFLPAGSVELSTFADQIFVNDENVLVFRLAATESQGYSVEVVSLDDLNPPEPGDTVDPVGLAYLPDETFLADDGTVLLYSKVHQSVFRWDPASEEYTQSIRLLGAAEYVAYSQDDNAFYAAYQSGLIRKIDLDDPALTEESFFHLPGQPVGLVVAGSYVVAEDSSGAWTTLTTISSSGIVADSKEWHYPSTGLIWDDSNQEIFYFSTYSPSDLHARPINADGSDAALAPGGIGEDRDTPLHGSWLIQTPVRVSPDGRTAVLGSGGIFDVETLSPTSQALGNSASDFAWLQGELFSVRNVGGVSQVQRWLGASYAPDGIRQFSSNAVRLLTVRDDVLLLISLNEQSIPVFDLLDFELNDTDIDGLNRTDPTIVWEPPAEMLAIDPLTEVELSATADVPGTFSYAPALGTMLDSGEQTLTVTFTPSDLSKYRIVEKSVNIRVWGVDFGDAPEQLDGAFETDYRVTFADDGARHVLRDGLRLGAEVDSERDGQPADSNDIGDNSSGIDEDGVEFPATIFSVEDDSASSLAVHATGEGYVTAWIDFNRDGEWSGSEEQVATDYFVQAGTTIISFEVPVAAKAGLTAARVRLSSEMGLSTHGLAEDGEVEDYLLEIREVGDPIEITPVDGGTITVLDSQGTDVIYMQGEHVLARYPKLLCSSVYYYHGIDEDELIVIPESLYGHIVLLGDAKAGVDRVQLGENQHLDLTEPHAERIQNIESIDLRVEGMNQLRLNSESAQAVSASGPLKVYYDSVDRVILDGAWDVIEQREEAGEAFHLVSDGQVSVYLASSNMMHNPIRAADVDHNGVVTPLDALLVINRLNRQSAEGEGSTESDFLYLDVSGDQAVTPIDALIVVNTLNEMSGEGEGSGLYDASADLGWMSYWDWQDELRRRNGLRPTESAESVLL